MDLFIPYARLFLFVRGYFFNRAKENKYPTVQKLISAKAKRLIFPLLFVWGCWNIPIKWISQYYAGIRHPLIVAIAQILFPYCVYLWFIEALFFIFIIDYYIEKIRNIKFQAVIVFFLFLSGLIVYRYLGEWNPLGNPLEYLLWFWSGRYIDAFMQRKQSNDLTIMTIAGGVCSIAAYILLQCNPHGFWLFNSTLLPILGIIWTWSLSILIDNAFCKRRDAIIRVSSYTYGIYLWAEPLNYLVLYLALSFY